MSGPIFDDEFMNDMLLNPDLYGLESEDERKMIKDDEEEEES